MCSAKLVIPNQAIAARLGITEGAVRYHLRRQAQAASDGGSKLSPIQSPNLQAHVERVIQSIKHEVVKAFCNDQLNLRQSGSPRRILFVTFSASNCRGSNFPRH